MAKEQSSIFQDIPLNCSAMLFDDSLFPFDVTNIDILNEFDSVFSSFDMYGSDHTEENETPTTMDQFASSSVSEVSSAATSQEQIAPSNAFPILNLSLAFINPPEPTYHVRYLSEITTSPLDGNVVDTRTKSKKNLSGRYLKGIRSRHVTITLPAIISDSSNLFIRVTRLTVPHEDISFIHPYPLLYSPPKKNLFAHVINYGSSIYFKINKEELCSSSKHFPNLILTRLKQCQLKLIKNLEAFDDKEMTCSLVGKNAKKIIATYQLKKSQLDFRLVIQCEGSTHFLDTNIFCRSKALLEEEGVEWRKSSK